MIAELAPWAAIAVSIASLIYTVVATRSKAAAEKVHAVDLRADNLEHRVTQIEVRMEHLPAKETTHRLEVSMLELRGEVAVLAERLKPVAAVSERLQEFLLEQADRRL